MPLEGLGGRKFTVADLMLGTMLVILGASGTVKCKVKDYYLKKNKFKTPLHCVANGPYK